MRVVALSLMLALALAGCGTTDTPAIDYKSAGKLPSLEVPPDLVSPTGENRYAIPELRGGPATLSEVSQQRQAAPTGQQGLLPDTQKARIERSGSQRWLVVQAAPEEVWPTIKDFWQETGFIINLESPETGVMETDWAENRAKLPQDVIRRTLGKLIDSMYSTAERDKFRTRVEPAPGGGTEIYISHRGMVEVYTNAYQDQTKWEPRPADPELEAEMLRRLMLRFGVQQERAAKLLAQQQVPEQARILREAGGAVLEIDEGFDRAWRRVGLALDRIGFVVEDRDRSRGIYFVRYIDPQIDNASKRDEGLLSKLAFWRSDKEQPAPVLQISVSEAGEKSRVSVAGADGKPVESDTQTRILNLLHKELK